jgi:glycerol-3-phosphate acyltransferase PlsX
VVGGVEYRRVSVPASCVIHGKMRLPLPRRGGRVVTVAVDAMGGDLGSDVVVEGAAKLSTEDVDIHVLLVGDPAALDRALSQQSYDPARISIVAADGHVGQNEDPRLIRERPGCSVMRASELVALGEADAIVSAGNTGALILAASTHLPRLPGIRRAALAAVYPTEQRHGPRGDPFALILDVGATSSADALSLVGFAAMGSAYSSIVSETRAPRVALLSNGTEPHKGTPEIIQAHRFLLDGPLNFVGNVEGLDIPRGTVDVVVTDGFLGNVALKMLEGVGDVMRDVVKKASSRRLEWRLGLSMLGGGLRQLRRMTDWKAYGGAPLLGLDGVVIKAHGRSEARAVRNAIKVAAKTRNGDLTGRIRDAVAALGLEEEEEHDGAR